jgi:hypothetical protein
VHHTANTLYSLTTALCHSNLILVTLHLLPPHDQAYHIARPAFGTRIGTRICRCARHYYSESLNSSHCNRRTDLISLASATPLTGRFASLAAQKLRRQPTLGINGPAQSLSACTRAFIVNCFHGCFQLHNDITDYFSQSAAPTQCSQLRVSG